MRLANSTVKEFQKLHEQVFEAKITRKEAKADLEMLARLIRLLQN